MAKRLSEIDSLRGYAVALVVFLHLNLLDPRRPHAIGELLGHTDMGTGVDLFFVISGLVISMALAPLWRACTGENALALKNVPLRFYQKRFIRLWPAAAFWLCANIALASIFHARTIWPNPAAVALKALSGLVYLYNFQELGNNGPLGYFWTLSVEWQFYLLLPVLLLLVRADTWRLAVLGAAYAALLYWQPGGPLWWLFRFDGLVFGVLLYVLLARLGIEIPHYASLRHGVLRAAVTLGLLAAMITAPRFVPDNRLGVVFANGLATPLVALAAADRGYVSTLGLPRLVGWLGARSYSIYLAHIPAIMAVLACLQLAARSGHVLPAGVFNLVFYGAGITLTALCAEPTYRWLERPSHHASQHIPLLPPAPAEAGLRAAAE